jgi:glycosyltransferase involved in cell wall biosynthesis
MDIIIASEASNRYIDQLVGSLSESKKVGSVKNSVAKFWRQKSDADIVHIQWPEGLFDWNQPKLWELAWLEEKLERWSSQASIVTTVHNYSPHGIDGCKDLYKMTYKMSDGIVHLGETSRQFFFDEYSFAAEKKHSIIPHGNYTCFPNEISKKDARNFLGIGGGESVILCFGEIRHPEERDLLIEAFDQLELSKKRLLIAGRISPPSRLSLTYWRLRYDPRFLVEEGWIPDKEVQLYLNAADTLVIPRHGVLNSGNVALGFTFGCVVVGPDEGVIGEVLGETGNPVYKPGDDKALARAIEETRSMHHNTGNENREYAMKKMNWKSISSGHLSFYSSVLK